MNQLDEDTHPGRVVRVARQIARELREEKSDHAWTTRECALLAQLCDVLGVDRHGKLTPAMFAELQKGQSR